MTLGIRNNTPNEIVQIESGCLPLRTNVRQQQKQFWKKIKEDIIIHPDAPISKLVKQAEEQNLPYVHHYNRLHDVQHTTAAEFGQAIHIDAINKIREKGNEDPLSKFGQYLMVNDDLKPSKIYSDQTMLESDRIILIRYRTGSHKLRIETERWDKTPRENRMCVCQTEPQTLEHVLYRCQRLTRTIPKDPLHIHIQTSECARDLKKRELLF